MILNQRFYNLQPLSRSLERIKLGLDAERVTGIVLFGGQGDRKTMLQIDRLLGESPLPIQLIFICGKNEQLVKQLRGRQSRLPRWIEGFTSQVPYYMQLADFFIGKPGPGSVAEAIAMRLPVIVERNAWTLPQERYNTDWVREQQVGLVVRNFSNVTSAVSELLENLPRFRQNTMSHTNQALFEIVRILTSIAGPQSSDALAGLRAPAADLKT
jgi:1,2-diacylglycerol 3-beta-galactosyltransferase